MRNSRVILSLGLLAGLFLLPVEGQAGAKKPREPQQEESAAVRAVVDRVMARENTLAQTLQNYRPRVETYLQEVRPDPDWGVVPDNDRYFLGQLTFDKGVRTRSYLSKPQFGFLSRVFGTFSFVTRPFKYEFEIDSFAQAALVDYKGLDRKHYRFQFVRSAFLGDLRCLLFDVSPRRHAGSGRFKGRIWVEDQDYTIVRFKGIRTRPPKFHFYVHFDSWRQNLQPGLWLPVYVYAEESDLNPPSFLNFNSGPVALRSQTRFWGYDLSNSAREEELARILVDAPMPVRDSSETAGDLSPLASTRRWEDEAEANVLERLEKARLIAAPGDVDKVLETVVNNLVVTNHLDNLPPVHCRVMLTLPFESFTVGHTIVISRGLIDVLPDEAALATMLAHELAHLVLGHATDTKYAFTDRLMMSDDELLETLDFARDPQEESTADAKAIELLSNSPYKDNLRNAALFLRAMAQDVPGLHSLFGAHLGNRLAAGDHVLRMAEMIGHAPQLQPNRLDQIAALPLGSRLKVDAWSGRVELMKSQPVAPVSAREKMPFLVTPLFPSTSRQQSATSRPRSQPKTTADNTPGRD
jgi:hypothetical protein